MPPFPDSPNPEHVYVDAGSGTITLSGSGSATSTAGTAVVLVPGDSSPVARPEFPHDHSIYVGWQPTVYRVSAVESHTLNVTPLDVVVFVLALCSLVAAGVIASRTAFILLKARFP